MILRCFVLLLLLLLLKEPRISLAFSSLYAYQAPRPGVDQRGPCPALNTLANHGYLPRTGQDVPTDDIIRYTGEVFGVSGVEAILRAALDVIRDVNGTDGKQRHVLNLGDLYRIQDSDASYSHQDAYFNNLTAPVRPQDDSLLDGVRQAAAPEDGVLTLERLADWQDERIQDSRRRNPQAAWNTLDMGTMAFNSAMFFYAFGDDPTMATVHIDAVLSFLQDHRFPEDFVPHVNRTNDSTTTMRNWLTDPLLVSVQSFFQNRIALAVPASYVSSNHPTVTDCLSDLQDLQFDIFDYDLYRYYFQESSRVILAPAGIYVGPENIEEYVRFADEGSPYIEEAETLVNDRMIKEVDQQAGECTFLVHVTQRYGMDSSLSREANYLVGSMIKIIYDWRQKYVSSVYVYYEQDYLTYFFHTLLNNKQMYNYICSVSEANCPDTNVGLSRQQCVEQLQELQLFTNGTQFDGKDYACRVLHASFAETNADHCAHVSFEPQEDVNGKVKCQISQGIQPTDLFDDDDIEDFRDFLDSERSLIESTTGFKILNMPEETPSVVRMIAMGVIVPIGIYVVFYFAVRQPRSDTDDRAEQGAENALMAQKSQRLWVILGTMGAILFVIFTGVGFLTYWGIQRFHDWQQREWQEDSLRQRYRGGILDIGQTSLFNNLSDDEFVVFTGFLTWGTVLFSGFGLEIFVWMHFTKVWTKRNEDVWRFAQFTFPLIMVTALGLALHQNYLCLPLLILGQWKFGFPETLMYLYLALYANKNNRRRRWTDFLNGFGIVVHHGSTALIFSMTVTGVVVPSRYALNVCLILAIQHWFTLLAYSNRAAYLGIVMVLEYFFEWAVLSDAAEIYYLHWTALWAVGCMLVAHWTFFVAGILSSLIKSDGSDGGGAEEVYERGNRAIHGTTRHPMTATTRCDGGERGSVSRRGSSGQFLEGSFRLAGEFLDQQSEELVKIYEEKEDDDENQERSLEEHVHLVPRADGSED